MEQTNSKPIPSELNSSELNPSDLIHSYDNGNVHVDLYADGTLVRTFDETKPIVVDFPSSMDVKITNKCDAVEAYTLPDGTQIDRNPVCAHCHEQSSPSGQHADLNKLLELIRPLHAGCEIAIGGGDALGHPDIVNFLCELKNRGIVANITVNQKHLHKHLYLLEGLIGKKLVNGIGISYSDPKYFSDIKPIIRLSDNVVFHLIMGINSVNDIDVLRDFCAEQNRTCKVLILGYKKFGNGISYYENKPTVEINKYKWHKQLSRQFKAGKLILSFDNLAIEQLEMRRFFSQASWDEFYLGKDGQFTMYIDAVKQQYAKSSTSTNRISWNEMGLIDFFKGLSP